MTYGRFLVLTNKVPSKLHHEGLLQTSKSEDATCRRLANLQYRWTSAGAQSLGSLTAGQKTTYSTGVIPLPQDNTAGSRD